MIWKWEWNGESDYYDGIITRDTDWGGDASTENQPVSGGRVQEWLKNEINGKFGVIRMSSTINEQNFYSLEMFSTKEDEQLYDEDNEKYSDLVTRVTIPISTVQGDSFTAFLSTTLPQNNIVVTDKALKVLFNYRAVRYTQGTAYNEGALGTIIVQRSTDNGSTWNEVGREENVLKSKEPNDTESVDEVFLEKYLTQGKQMLRVRATYAYEDIASGEIKQMNSPWVNVGASITKTTMKLELVTEYHMPMKPTDANGNVQPFNVTYRVFGSVQKTLFLKIDGGSELKYEYAASVDSVPQTVQASGNQYLTHGVHKVEAWLQCEDGLGGTITSEKLVNRFMMVADASNTKPYLMLQNVDGKIDNFVQTEVAEFAVYAPNQEKVDVAFLLTTYTTDYETNKPSEYFRLEQSVIPQTPNKLLTTVEIEAENDAAAMDTYNTYFRVRRISDSKESDFILESTPNEFTTGAKQASYKIDVDNTNAMTPVSGATFLMNPKVRNNNEANPKTILNAKNNNAVVDSTWTNIGLINDGWMTDDEGNKVLRIMAGGQLEIKKNVWAQFRTNPNSSLTFEIDCKISNVTNTTDPIIQMFSGTASTFRGLKMNALEGWLRNGTEQSSDDTLFAWQEDVRTHFSFNLNHQVFPNKGDVKYADTDASKANGSIALARVLVNGDCVREMKYDTTKVDEWSSSDEGSIIIGNEGADIDIYSIRIYENKQIDTIDILTRNYLASLPKADDKLALKQKNDLLDGGLISLEKTKNAKLNSMVWHGILPYKNNSSEQKGWIEIFRYDANGNFLADLSGTICKETKSLEAKGQGSTAKTYYDWNIQEDSSKVTDTIQVAVKDFHESISVRIDGDQAYIKGGNLGKNFPLEETEVAYPYANGYVTVPDGWVDGNGKYRGMGYMVAYGTALAQKRVIKINYASSMQSHLLGACKTYDLLHRKVVGDTPLQERVPSAVAAKHTEPFMYFNQEGNSNTYFKGMGTYGAGKADKVAWGFVKKEMPMYALIEGSDNNLPMTGFRVPFDKNTAVYDCDGEGWLYNGVQSFDFDLGNTEHWSDATQSGEGWKFVNTDANDGKVPSKAIRDKWADIHNFIYLHTTNLKFFDGTFEQFKESSAAQDTNYKYWCTQGNQAFYLKRYDFINKQWIDAGLWAGASYASADMSKTMPTVSAYNTWVSGGTGDYSSLNSKFIESYVNQMKDFLSFFINEKSLQFNYCYVLGFLAGTDNSDKNTYYKIMPYGVSQKENSTFASWYKSRFGRDFDFKNVHQLYFDGDDMDSILRTDNNSHLTKPYYIDRLHPYADENPNKSLYEGMGNQLFNYVEKAYEGTNELASVMNQIMIAATELIDENDTKDNKLVGGKSLWGFLNKYFFNIQRYFPQIAYLEQARIRYEFPELLGYISSGGGARSIRPITQSLGSQLQAELQYMNQRVIYMTSYAGFGAWGGDEAHSIGLADANETFGFMPANMPDGSGATYTFTITPHQYIYPSYYLGQTFTSTHKRTSPNQTCTFTIAENLKDGGDTGIGICGINYISDLGRLGTTSVTAPMIINGKRLKCISITGGNADCRPFRAESLSISSKNITEFNIGFTASNAKWVLDLSKQTRLKTFSEGSAFINSVIFPETHTLENVQYNYAFDLDSIIIRNAPNLRWLTVGTNKNGSHSTDNNSTIKMLREVIIGENVGIKTDFSAQILVEDLHKCKAIDKPYQTATLETLIVKNIGNPTDGKGWLDLDVNVMEWLADIPTCELKGTIAIKETDEYRPAVTWDLKNKFLAKFGNVDNKVSSNSKGLILAYKSYPFVDNTALLKGSFFADDFKVMNNEYAEKEVFNFSVVPYSRYMNNQTKIEYSVEGNGKYSMNKETGDLTVNMYELSDKEHKATIKAVVNTYTDGVENSYTLSKEIAIWNRPAQVGDLVYADGTYSSEAEYNSEKTIVGRCFYVAPKKNGKINESLNNPNDKWLRMMVASKFARINDNIGNPWGPMQLANNESFNKSQALYTTKEDGSRESLSIPALRSIYNPDTPNYGMVGLTLANGASTNYIYDEAILDTTSDSGIENDGFKVYPYNTKAGDGFGANTSTRVLTKDLAVIAGDSYKEGDIVNNSYANTLKIILHRNKIIQHVQSGGTINGIKFPLEMPIDNNGRTEIEHLATLIDSIKEWAKSDNGLGDEYGDRWQQLYFPAVSSCYHYEPTVREGEVLASRFKKHNWAVPTIGVLARIMWYVDEYTGSGIVTRTGSPLLPFKEFEKLYGATLSINYNGEYVFHYTAGNISSGIRKCEKIDNIRPITSF